MDHDGEAFEAYRSSPPRAITLPRLLAGTAVAVICWLVVTLIAIVPVLSMNGGDVEAVFASRTGVISMLASFAGIWIGVWVAMRFVHREPLRNLLGVGGRVAMTDFWKGFAAVVLTSILSEILIYMIRPEMTRTEIDLVSWLVMLVPVAVLTFVQTSSEEVLFRGYLLRGLANRFRSAWIWALLPGIAFLSLHLSPSMSIDDLMLVLVSIGSLTVALTLTVFLTGNLGAAFGMHFANNLSAFAVIAHQKDLGGFALYRGAPIENLGSGAWTIGVIALICVALTVALLVHRASPLNIRRS